MQRLSAQGEMRGVLLCAWLLCCVPACDPQQPLSMAREFDLVTSWNTYITNSTILKVRGAERRRGCGCHGVMRVR
jgi:hypothetical protein